MTQIVVGSCTQCGLCCRRLTMPLPRPDAWRGSARAGQPGVIVPLPRHLSDDQRAFYAARGLATTVPPVAGGGEVAFVPINTLGALRVIAYPSSSGYALAIPSRCPHLTDENLCDVHGTDDQPRVCRDGPVAADVPLLKPECSFEVEDADDG